jgi:uncharacterized membrane protein YeaQ/YmgE (transglycosylase-associated protein family)
MFGAIAGWLIKHILYRHKCYFLCSTVLQGPVCACLMRLLAGWSSVCGQGTCRPPAARSSWLQWRLSMHAPSALAAACLTPFAMLRCRAQPADARCCRWLAGEAHLLYLCCCCCITGPSLRIFDAVAGWLAGEARAGKACSGPQQPAADGYCCPTSPTCSIVVPLLCCCAAGPSLDNF